MKRILALLIALILLISLLIPAVSAKEIQDSTNVEDTILWILEMPEDAAAIRIFPFSFFDSTSPLIDDLLSGNKKYCYIAVFDDDKNFKAWSKEAYSSFYWPCELDLDPVALQFYFNGDLTQFLGSDIVVNNVFFLTDSGANTAIYYHTNKGGYVYSHNEYIEPCLFSSEAFDAYMHFLRRISFMHDDFQRNIALALSPWKLSAYTLGSASFNPDANDFPLLPYSPEFMSCAVMILLAIAVILALVFIYKKKYKEHNFYEDNKGTTFDPDFVIAHTLNDYVYDPENLPVNPN